MTINREQVADLQPGDVITVGHTGWPDGVTVTGPLHSFGGEYPGALYLGGFLIRTQGGVPAGNGSWLALTVVSRAPRPFYVNHPRPEPVPGDVVRDADSDDARSWSHADPRHTGEICWRNTGRSGWCRRGDLPARLRLLVDGETGRCVP